MDNKQSAEYRTVIEETLGDTIYFVADLKITSNNQLLLYRLERTVSRYKVNSLIEQKCRMILNEAGKMGVESMNILYSHEISRNEISEEFQKMSGQIRYAPFWRKNEIYASSQLPEISSGEVKEWSESMKDLENAVYGEDSGYREVISYLFEQCAYPQNRVEVLKEMIYFLENTLRKIEKKESVWRETEESAIFKVEEIKNYYINAFTYLYRRIHENEQEKYSHVVLEMMRYIRKNYTQDLTLDMMGDIFAMNGVYLGQVFKKEVGITFLKYVTNVRMEEAKRLLGSGKCNISETAQKVGYKTSQYFSQIFAKSVGMKPQEYRKWSEHQGSKKH